MITLSIRFIILTLSHELYYLSSIHVHLPPLPLRCTVITLPFSQTKSTRVQSGGPPCAATILSSGLKAADTYRWLVISPQLRNRRRLRVATSHTLTAGLSPARHTHRYCLVMTTRGELQRGTRICAFLSPKYHKIKTEKLVVLI